MKSGASRSYFDAMPATPAYAPVTPPPGKPANPDKLSLKGTDGYSLELARLTGKWYISKSPI